MRQILSILRSKFFNAKDMSRDNAYVKRKYICVRSSVFPDETLSYNEQARYIHKEVLSKYGVNETTTE